MSKQYYLYDKNTLELIGTIYSDEVIIESEQNLTNYLFRTNGLLIAMISSFKIFITEKND